ncbi:helix-turn-helix transcriptional regulator [Paenibacillus sp. LjRoot56]|uniref:helix-turn-helix transcriptional regulator n=1 Tax=Paenibacillus sp. LjRoot56 TaxID=3342333 RepID=UPI003F4FA833
MSQAEFARRIDVSEPYVSQIIKGKTTFSLLKAKHAADVLNCNIEDLYVWIPEIKGKRL